MLQPQSDDEIAPVVEALRRLDPLLAVRWNAQSIKKERGFDVLGVPREPDYEGRWEIVRYESPAMLNEGRGFALVLRVTERTWAGVGAKRYPVMEADGPYAPLGMWLVEYMQLWDRAQTAFAGAMDVLWGEHEEAEQFKHDTAASQEALERVYREHGGGEYWMGRGFGPGQAATSAPAPIITP